MNLLIEGLGIEDGGQMLEAKTSGLVDWRKFEDHLWFASLALATPQPCLAGSCLPPGRARGGSGTAPQLTTSQRLVVICNLQPLRGWL